MATATLTQSPPRSRSKLRLLGYILAAVALGILLALALAAGWFYQASVASLPQLDGTIQLAGLSGPVTVVRDAQGVPHISANSMEDLLFAQGFVTAQDRLWQMDLSRRFGRGELSEILGSRLLTVDKRQRTLNLKAVAAGAVAQLAEDERHYLDAYVRGVNALIERQRKQLPIEFRVLRYEPRAWTAEDSLMVGVNISQNLNTQYPLERSREALIANLPPEIVADLYPNTSWRDRPPSALPRSQQHLPDAPPPGSPGPNDDPGLKSWLGGFSPLSDCDSCVPGSNNWVVSGEHTTTGKPLLSNDMHLGHSIPNVWYEVHMKSGAYDVAGFSFPGLPFVVAGHNQRIAWGFTNVGPDVQDLYIESFNTAGEYQTPSGWQKPEIKHEVIKVKGEADVPLDVVITRHGPIVSGLFPGESRKLALKWTIYDTRTISLSFVRMGTATNWQEFRAAISTFGGAGQNVVYADVDGNIGYQTTGWIPIRASGDGLLPVPGNDDAHEWTGYVPFESLPSVFNPASGMVTTANGRITPDDFPFLIANQWGSAFRTERIYKMLESGQKFSPRDMIALQMDTHSAFDRLCADRFVYAIDHTKQSSERVHKAADLMRGWDGRMEISSVAATVAVRSRQKLWKLLLEPKFHGDWQKYQWFNSSTALEKILATRPNRWLPSQYSNYEQLLTAAVEAAVNEKDVPKDLGQWTWGKNSPVEIEHPIFGQIPFLKSLAGPGIHPQSGSGSLTVKAAGREFGASERATYDLANLDNSNMNIVTGQSGQLFSPYYMDQWDAWYTGKSFLMPFSDEAVSTGATHRLVLRP